MAINKNHEFEELNGVKCSIVEKNAGPARVAFLKRLLEFNKFEVIVVPSPPAKATPASPPAPANASAQTIPPVLATSTTPTTSETPANPSAQAVSATPDPATPPVKETQVAATPPPETFTIGVTDYTFNPINAIFGRLLKTPDGHVVTQAYWYQKEDQSHDEIPYYEKN
jgi:hypothetical protein